MHEHKVYQSTELCWRCNHNLVKVVPPIESYSYYCTHCHHLTSIKAELDAAMRDKEPNAIDIVAAVNIHLPIKWEQAQ